MRKRLLVLLVFASILFSCGFAQNKPATSFGIESTLRFSAELQGKLESVTYSQDNLILGFVIRTKNNQAGKTECVPYSGKLPPIGTNVSVKGKYQSVYLESLTVTGNGKSYVLGYLNKEDTCGQNKP